MRVCVVLWGYFSLNTNVVGACFLCRSLLPFCLGLKLVKTRLELSYVRDFVLAREHQSEDTVSIRVRVRHLDEMVKNGRSSQGLKHRSVCVLEHDLHQRTVQQHRCLPVDLPLCLSVNQ